MLRNRYATALGSPVIELPVPQITCYGDNSDTRATDTQSITTTYDDYYHGYESFVFNNYKYEWQNIKKDISEDDDETVITNNKYEECFNTGSKEKIETESNYQNRLGGNRYAALTLCAPWVFPPSF